MTCSNICGLSSSGWTVMPSGSLLDLDQVLRKPWSNLDHFWTLTYWLKMERLGGAEIADITDFAGYVDPIRGPLGFL
jgi:hypothetical protein